MLILGLALSVLLLVFGYPIWMAFLVFSLLLLSGLPPEVLAIRLFNSLDVDALLAVPGYVFAAEIMVRSGMAQRLIDWVANFFGRVPGGMPITTIAGAEAFGAISGSSTATIAALGKVMYPALRQDRYGDDFSLGLVTSMGAIALIIPPSITMILYGALAPASVGKLFLAGIIPGILIGLVVAAYAVWYALKHDVRSHARGLSWSAIGRSTKAAAWTLGAPLIIFGGIYTGFSTPTEASVVLSVYAVVIAMLVHRDLDLSGLWQATLESALLTAKIFIIVAAASAFSVVLVLENIPQALVDIVLTLELSPVTILLTVNLVLLVVGMFMDPNSALVVFVPLLVPLATAAGIDVIHLGIIVTVNLAIGMFTPPFGINLFVSSSIFNAPITRVIWGCVPFNFLYLGALGAITYIPQLSLWLPSFWQ